MTAQRSGDATFFIDGVAAGTVDISAYGTDISNSRPFRIGRSETFANQFDGVIDEVKVWNRALTASEVATESITPPGCAGDLDCDGASDATDNCPTVANAAQTNTDGNNTAMNRPGQDPLGDACDVNISGDGYMDSTKTSLGESLAYCATMRADINNNGPINSSDLTLFAGAYGSSFTPVYPGGIDPPLPGGRDQRANQNGDTTINSSDLVLFAYKFSHNVSECP